MKLTLDEAAIQLGKTVRQVRYLVQKGELPDIAEWLHNARRLELNRKRWRVLPTAQPTNFLGYRISRAGIMPGRKLKKKMRKRLRELRHASPDKIERSLRSYRGLMTFG